jgi:16S rRNA (guanine(966)-N(2))-methyltransferase RsmD
MRIVAGLRKGARLSAPRGEAVRPTTDVVREAAFDLIGPVEGAEVLDLFGGSGAMALEALSRGAARAVVVERDRAALAVIRRNATKLALPGLEVRPGDALRVLAEDARAGAGYDLVLIDPPYAMLPLLMPRLAVLVPPVLRAGGTVVVETPADVEPALPLPMRTTRRYGASRLTLFEAPR